MNYRINRGKLIVAMVYAIVFCFLFSFSVYAADLQLNTPYTQQLLTATQIVMHRFVLDKPGVLIIQCTPSVGVDDGVNWKLRLSDSQLQIISEVEVMGGAEATTSSRLRLPQGTYDLRLTAGDRFSNSELTLLLSFDDESEILAEREQNDSQATATSLEINKVLLGNIQSPADTDVFRLQPNEEGLLIVQLEADRAADGHYWAVELQKEDQEMIRLSLDPMLHQSMEIEVTEGIYYLYITSLSDSWSDVDYRLITRFQAQKLAETPELPQLELGGYTISSTTNEDKAEYRVVYAPKTADQDTLAFRLRSLEDDLGGWHAEMYDNEQRLVWQSLTAASQETYAELITGLSNGEYRLTFSAYPPLTSAASFEFGLFYPEDLNTKLELQIGNPEMIKNGVTLEIDPGFTTTPLLIENRTMLPIRSLVQTLGGRISWEEGKQQVSITCNGHQIELWIGNSQALIDGVAAEVSVAPVTIGGRTMLPLRFVSEALGCYVQWQDEEEKIIIWN